MKIRYKVVTIQYLKEKKHIYTQKRNGISTATLENNLTMPVKLKMCRLQSNINMVDIPTDE